MERHTEYIRGYGWTTTTGDGILDTITEGIKTLVTSKAVRDAGSEALKAAAKSGGDKLGTKIVERAFDRRGKEKQEKQQKPTNLDDTVKVSPKQNNDILKQIYGDSLFSKRNKKQKGSALLRL